MRALVTGATGFAGKHLVQLLLKRGYTVWGTYLVGQPAEENAARLRLLRCDIRNKSRVRSIVQKVRPHRVYHLAAFSSVRESVQNFRAAFDTNFWGTFNLLEAIRQAAPTARVLIVGSGQCYGPQKRTDPPVTESHPLSPQDPYSLSKAAADMLAYYYYKHFGLHVVRARPFNHTGPGQSPHFVCPDFARQIAAINLNLSPPILHVGELRVWRDFSDMRDVVLAYQMLLEKGKPGEAYNVASGQSRSLQRIVQSLSSFSAKPIQLIVDPDRLRAGQVRVLCGSSRKLRRATGWRPQFTLPATLKDLYLYWEHKLQASAQHATTKLASNKRPR